MDELVKLLKQIYPGNYEIIINELNRITPIPLFSSRTNISWHKKINLYVTYPDAFEKDGKRDLFTLADKISYIKDLGFNALHILPFLDSPMIDGGFDIKNFLGVRNRLGGMKAIDDVILQCKKYNIKLFMDLVMNHISDQHGWFQKALAGEEKYRNYFLFQKDKPLLIKKYADKRGHWAEYKINEKPIRARIIFPQFTKELPHWIQGKDGYWYYHTFYQYQPDLNWYNPEVFIEFIEIIKFWASKGMSFRLDAITFMAKDLNSGIIESNPKLHLIIRALNIILKMINPDSYFLAEAGQPLDKIKEYFGDNRQEEAALAYNFKLMQSLWYSYVTKDAKLLAHTLKDSFHKIPNHASWINFLRNHDELTLEFTDEDIRKTIYDNLIKNGMDFRDGFGVSGRTMNFVGSNPDDLIFMYKVLASMPGAAALIYGDEIGKENDVGTMDAQTKYETEVLRLENVDKDTRDINRGTITEEEISKNDSKYIYSQIAEIFNKRLELLNYFQAAPICKHRRNFLTLTYKFENKSLKVIIDFDKKTCTWQEIQRTFLNRIKNLRIILT